MRLIFMGTPDFAVPTLIELAARGHEIVAVYTRAPKPAGRGMDLQRTPVEREARGLGLAIHAPKTLKDNTAVEILCAQCRCSGRGCLRTDPSEGDSRSAALGLLQRARFVAAALARCRAHQSRHYGG